MPAQTAKPLPVACVAVALLLAGSALLLAVLYGVLLYAGNLRDPAQAQLALGLYYKVVVVKGLVPMLAVALVAHVFTARRVGPLGAWALAATCAYALVAPLLLTRAFGAWPALEMQSAAQHAGTFGLMIAATTASGWIAERIVARARPTRDAARPEPVA